MGTVECECYFIVFRMGVVYTARVEVGRQGGGLYILRDKQPTPQHCIYRYVESLVHFVVENRGLEVTIQHTTSVL